MLRNLLQPGYFYLLIFALVCGGGGPSLVAAASTPNVVIILLDDAGYTDFGFRGSEEIETPEIDNFASNGARFTQAYATVPQCMPSRAALITGRYAQRFGIEYNGGAPNTGLPQSEETIAEILKSAGYRTGLVGKWHLGFGDGFHPFEHGFDEFYGIVGGWSDYIVPPWADVHPRLNRGVYIDGEPDYENAGATGYATRVLTGEAINFIEAHKDEPFFLFLSYNAPHGPLEAPQEYLDMFSHIEDENRRTYAAMMKIADEGVGAFIDALKAKGLYENTLLFFTNDHSGKASQNASSSDPFRGEKTDVWEGGVRVPFIVNWPVAFSGGIQINFPASLLDMAATIEAATGADSTNPLDGINLLPYLDGDFAEAPGRSLYWRFRWAPDIAEFHRKAVRKGKWKWIDQESDNKYGELYDLESDPGETNDLSAQFPDRTQNMREEWIIWERTLIEPIWSRPAVNADVVTITQPQMVLSQDGVPELRISSEGEHLYDLQGSDTLQNWNEVGVSFYGDRNTKIIKWEKFPAYQFYRFQVKLYEGEIMGTPENIMIWNAYDSN